MHMLLIVSGLLLIVLGGGYTLVVAGVAIKDPTFSGDDLGIIFGLWFPLGLLPIGIGIRFLRKGLRMRRHRRRSELRASRAQSKGSP